jgi:hypothetical protein
MFAGEVKFVEEKVDIYAKDHLHYHSSLVGSNYVTQKLIDQSADPNYVI